MVCSFSETSDSIAVRVRVPFVKESDVNVTKDSDDLIITAKHDADLCLIQSCYH